MINGLMLAWADYGFQNFLAQLETIGFFSYVLPFLLIFAFVYAILSKIPTFADSKGSVFIVSIAVGFLSLQFELVPRFFAIIFPQLGVGLSILLAALILGGVFLQGTDLKNYQWIFFGLGALIFIVIAISSLSSFDFNTGYWWQQYGSLAIVIIFIIVALVVIAVLNKNGSGSGKGPGG